MKKIKEMLIETTKLILNIDGKEEEAILASKVDLETLKSEGIDSSDCGRQMCYKGYVRALVDASSSNGCQWFKTRVRCNEY